MTGREINLLGARTLPRQGGMSHLREGLGRRVLSYLEGVSMSPREGGAMNRGEPPAPLLRQKAAAARLTPGRGDFPF